MENFKQSTFLFFLLLLILPFLVLSTEDKQVYIVYFGEHSGEKTTQEIEDNHHSYLSSVKETEEYAKSSLLYSYKHSINGFAAFLTSQEASKLSERDEVVSVFRSHPEKYSMHTTRSWEFSGLQESKKVSELDKDDYMLLKSRYGKNVIIGMLDSGIWPESESFSDKGMGCIPKSWKGTCESGHEFNASHCNRKIIGARYYLKAFEKEFGPVNKTIDYRSARDKDGHGTHTASTAAGRRVSRAASLGGFAGGTATGGAPLARLAIYKVCWALNEDDAACNDADILAAIDDAIGDGVNVLSISLGAEKPFALSEDSTAIGALHAVKKDIVVACSAGNSGPDPATVVNSAPWIMTVGASSVDRRFPSPIVLGNKIVVMGESVTPYKAKNKMFPLALASQLTRSGVPKNISGSKYCLSGSLSPQMVKGKIVLCKAGYVHPMLKGDEVKRAGGVGVILTYGKFYGNTLLLDANILPETSIDYNDALTILDYINTTKEPTAKIFPAKSLLEAKPAPFMAAFSSTGPNSISPDILKPDITAPGLNILAAWSGASPPTNIASDNRRVKYNILSGTSMSAPHVAGALALLKALHPNWSSAALRSAIMTSAEQEDNTGNQITDSNGNPANPFQFGSGHFNPTKAANPGLVYDASYTDYLLFLCSIGDKNLTSSSSSFECPKNPPSAGNLNYPSVAIPRLNGTVTISRTVTNVGSCSSVYFINVKPPQGISVKISPLVLVFNKLGQKIRFAITVKVQNQTKIEKGKYLFGEYKWYNADYSVRSPIAVSVD
ncbi:subtilase family protein [Striga hermonthica]|uniref:Subtilase family protein n=1 Tax=Striga hermonthica TaxID=68872 RepID=A0A9N7N7L5_STRHE|nr:subtilase family protein [Striga hermonthica]